MNEQILLTDEAIRAAIARRATSGDSGDLRERVLAATAAAPQRRGWRVSSCQIGAPGQRRAAMTLALAVTLLLAAALVIALVGSRPTPSLGRLAYFSQGDLYVTEPGGTTPRRIWDVLVFPNSTSSELVWLDSETVLVQNPPAAPEDGVSVVDVTNGARRLLDPGVLMALSPNHRVVAILAVDASEIRLLEIATGAVVGRIPGSIDGSPAAWSPDGRFLLGESPDTVYRVDISTGERTDLATELCCGLGPAHTPTWSPDGARVVYVDYHSTTEPSIFGPRPRDCSFRCGTLWSVGADGGAPTRLTPELGSETQPAFSPDGRWIAYLEESVHAANVVADLVVIAADGSGRLVLTPGWGPGPAGSSTQSWTSFSWDPDSAGISGLSTDGALWQIRLDGRSSRIETPPVSGFAWQVVP